MAFSGQEVGKNPVYGFVRGLVAFNFCAPFTGLPFLVWAYFVFAFIVHPHSQIWHYNLVDNDDYLYLTQAMDWVAGQPYFDRLQHRIDPPFGAVDYFSPLMNVIYGLPIKALGHFFDPVDAATMVSVFYPLLFLALFLWAVRRLAVDLVGKEWAGFSGYIALFCFTVMLQFFPGRIDHHGLEQVVAVTAILLVNRMMTHGDDRRWPVLAGALLGFGLSIALEILPFLLLVMAWIGIWASIEGRAQARSALLCAASLAASSVVFLLLSWPPEKLFVADVGYYSIVYVGLCCGILVSFVGVFAASRLGNFLARIGMGALCGIASAVLFASVFPQIMHGPFGGSNAEVVETVFAHSEEAHPLLDGGPLIRSICLPILALTAQVFYLWRRRLRAEWINGLILILLATTFLMAIFMQQRMMMYAETLAIIPLTRLSRDLWRTAAKWDDVLLRRAFRLFAILLVGPLTTVLLWDIVYAGESVLALALFPVQITSKSCDENGLVDALNSTYGDRRRLIMNTMGQSMELLFRTPHQVITSPFHTNTQGNLDSYAFFTARSGEDAHKIIERHPADLVVMCRDLEDFYVTPVVPAESGKGGATFATQLVEGHVPDWLTPIDNPAFGNMLLFVVSSR